MHCKLHSEKGGYFIWFDSFIVNGGFKSMALIRFDGHRRFIVMWPSYCVDCYSVAMNCDVVSSWWGRRSSANGVVPRCVDEADEKASIWPTSNYRWFFISALLTAPDLASSILSCCWINRPGRLSTTDANIRTTPAKQVSNRRPNKQSQVRQRRPSLHWSSPTTPTVRSKMFKCNVDRPSGGPVDRSRLPIGRNLKQSTGDERRWRRRWTPLTLAD